MYPSARSEFIHIICIYVYYVYIFNLRHPIICAPSVYSHSKIKQKSLAQVIHFSVTFFLFPKKIRLQLACARITARLYAYEYNKWPQRSLVVYL